MKLSKSLIACSVFSAVVGCTIPASAITFTNTFQNRTVFENSLSSFSVEDFNNVTSETDYSSTPFDAGDFTLSASGNTSSTTFNENFTEVTPQSGIAFSVYNINSTAQATGGVNNPDGKNIYTFDTPITAFGADFAAVGDNNKITNLVSGNASVQFPVIPENPNPSQSFFGVISDTPFTEISIAFGQPGDDNEIDGYGVDNITFGTASTTQQPVPFETEGTMGLIAIGGFLGYRYLKKRKQALS